MTTTRPAIHSASSTNGRPRKRKLKGRVSSFYGLGASQPELDFIDVDVYRDTPLFIDPGALRTSNDPWSEECVFLLQTFFEEVVQAIKRHDLQKAYALLSALHEPNDTRLGLSKGAPAGRAVGLVNAQKLIRAFQRSKAATSGLLRDLEDAVLFVPGIGSDIISDMTTNIIRSQLIAYTKSMCDLHPEITKVRTPSGITWDGQDRRWRDSEFDELPVAGGRRLLLVPKFIVRKKLDAARDDLYSHFLLDFLAERELSAPNSELVYVLKSGRKKVDRTKLRKRYKNTKEMVEAIVLQNPTLYEDFKESVFRDPHAPLSNEDITDVVEEKRANFDDLLLAVVSCNPGADDFDRYEKALRYLLNALFYPNLIWPKPQFKLFGGIKRVDIMYHNKGVSGFFRWLTLNHPSGNVFIEAKNYSHDVENPEFDQLAGRFSPNAGRFGFLICRTLANRKAAIEKARTFALTQQKFMVPLTDDDLRMLIEARKVSETELARVLQDKFNEIAL